MSTSAPEVSGLVRLSVFGPGRRVDLAVPARVPVAELLPEVARAVGALDPFTVHGGYRLVRADGTRLRAAYDLASQGVGDGSVLTLEIGADDRPPTDYDDVVEAVADAVESTTRPWSPAASRRAALGAAALLLLVASVGLGLERARGVPVAVGAGVLAVLLVTGAAVLARARGLAESAVVVAWLAVAPAAAAGLAAAPRDDLERQPLLVAGLAALVAAALGAVAVVEFRPALLPGATAALAAVAGGGVGTLTDADVAAGIAVWLVVTVGVSALAPALAASAARLRTPEVQPDQARAVGVGSVAPAVDSQGVERAVRRGHGMLLGLTASTGLLSWASAIPLVHLGVSGLLLGVAVCAIVLFRTRRSRDFADVALGITAGLVGLTTLLTAAAVVHPGWRPALVGVGIGVGIVLLVMALVHTPGRLATGRSADVAEGVAMVAVLPLLVLALGVVATVRS